MGQTDLRYLKVYQISIRPLPQRRQRLSIYRRFLACQKQQNILSQMCTGSTTSFTCAKNGSGAIKRKIEDEFGNAISAAEKKRSPR